MKIDVTRPADAAAARPERVLRGLGVSAGIAIGPAHVVESGFEQVPEYVVIPSEIESERQRFAEAVARSVKQLRKLKAKAAALPEAAAEEVGLLLDAHLAILSGSRLVRGVERRIVEQRQNAEYAVQAELVVLAQQFEAMDDAYLAARIHDVRDASVRLIRNLTARKYQAFSQVVEGSIVMAEELTPADAALMDPRRIAGLAAALGGAESHTAIMARSLGLPAVLGVAGLPGGLVAGQTVIVDGGAGIVILDPEEPTLADYRRRQAVRSAERERRRPLIDLPAVTRDGIRIALQANLELPREAAEAAALGAEGVGLVRTEFLYMNREDLPGEDEQYEALKALVETFEGRPVTLRTLDLGGDKLAPALGAHFAEQANPALGLRAVRLSLREPRLLETQLAAILRAAAHGQVRILLPMIAHVSELRAVRAALLRVARRLTRRRVSCGDRLPPLGVMIEVPAAALAADSLARESDFFALGTNDLIQYTLAVDRGDERLAGLYDPLHPAVLRLIRYSVEAALAARLPISVCGEMAGDPRFTALLLGLGVRELSVAPAKLLEIKERIRALDLVAARRRAEAVLDQVDPDRIAVLVDEFNEAL